MNRLQVNFEELKREQWSAEEANNAQLVAGFVQELMNNHNFHAVVKDYGTDTYTQHNRSMTDGIYGVIDTLTQLIKRYPDYSYDVKRIWVDGEYVIIHSHATLRKRDRGNDKRGLNIIDTWRVKDGNIVEHWDAVQPLDGFMRFIMWINGGSIRNSNGVF